MFLLIFFFISNFAVTDMWISSWKLLEE